MAITGLNDLLIVEDNQLFIDGADKALKTNPGIKLLHYASDHDTAVEALATGKYNSAIIDCFFPKRVGSQDRTLGKEVIEKLLSQDPSGRRMDIYEQALGEVLDLNDPQLRRLARYIGSQAESDDPEKDLVTRSLIALGKLGKEVNSVLQRGNSKTVFRKVLDGFRDYYTALRKGLEADPANQALGILVAEKAEQRGIPFVLATSTYHHDEMTQPIQDYCGKRRWTLVDCDRSQPQYKQSPKFWEGVYQTLVGKK